MALAPRLLFGSSKLPGKSNNSQVIPAIFLLTKQVCAGESNNSGTIPTWFLFLNHLLTQMPSLCDFYFYFTYIRKIICYRRCRTSCFSFCMFYTHRNHLLTQMPSLRDFYFYFVYVRSKANIAESDACFCQRTTKSPPLSWRA